MPAVEFQGVHISLPSSDGLHFKFQKGVMVVDFTNFTGQVVMTPGGKAVEEETKSTAIAAGAGTRRGRTAKEQKRLSPHTPPEELDDEPETALTKLLQSSQQAECRDRSLYANGKKTRSRTAAVYIDDTDFFDDRHLPPVEVLVADNARSNGETFGCGDELQEQELVIRTAPPIKEKLEPAAKRRLIEAPTNDYTWRRIDTLSSEEPEPCWGASAVLISAHEVLIYGGDDGDKSISDVWIVDRDQWSWSKVSLAFPGTSRAWHSSTLVGTTMVVFGGEQKLGDEDEDTKSFNDVAVFDTEARVWFPAHVTGTPPSPRAGHSATAVPGRNKVMVFGGVSGSKWLNDVHVLDTGVWNWYKPTVRGSPPKPRSYHSATVVGSKVIVYGGNGSSKCFKEVYVLDTETWAWSQPEVQGDAPHARTGHTATAGADGRSVIVFGGWDYKDSYSTSKVFDDVHVLDTLTWQWRQPKISGTSPTPRCGQASCFIEDENNRPAVLIFGGQLQGERKCNDLYLLSPS